MDKASSTPLWRLWTWCGARADAHATLRGILLPPPPYGPRSPAEPVTRIASTERWRRTKPPCGFTPSPLPPAMASSMSPPPQGSESAHVSFFCSLLHFLALRTDCLGGFLFCENFPIIPYASIGNQGDSPANALYGRRAEAYRTYNFHSREDLLRHRLPLRLNVLITSQA